MDVMNDDAMLIDGDSKQVVVLSNDDYSALSAFLYGVRGDADALRQFSAKSGMGLGANQIGALSSLWGKLNGVDLSA